MNSTLSNRATCNGPIKSSPSTYWLSEMDHTGPAKGYAPNAPNPDTYPIWRNVRDYADNLQNALNDDGNGGSRKGQGIAKLPAEVYIPGGVYELSRTLEVRAGTIIVGDPLDVPVLKAGDGFEGDTLVKGFDEGTGDATTSFMTLVKNVKLDTTGVGAGGKITALQWGVAQGAGLTNVQIDISAGHTGINLDGGSTIAVTDVRISGGGVGIENSNQQVNFKGIAFTGCETAFKASGGHTALLQGATFESCGTGVDLTATDDKMGSLVLLDSTSINSGPVVKLYDSSNDNGSQDSQVLIENLSHDNENDIVVDNNGQTRLAATPQVDTWVFGTVVPGQFETGQSFTTSRPDVLLENGKYFTKAQPTYAEYASDQFVNVKTVAEHPVKGDGSTDDSDSLNAILAANAADCKITYFPYGVYIVRDTLVIPANTRIVGEAWAVVSAAGEAFQDAQNPKPVVQIGQPGDTGVVEIQDMRFTVSEVLPGAKIIELNIAGTNPGDVGLWNTMVTVGGTADTSISRTCGSQDPSGCMAAYMVLHLTETSSAYLENFWGWTADHNLDDGGTDVTIISTGRGILVEAHKGTWLTGTGAEHHWLYNYNFHDASNVYAGLLQTESPYMQGTGAVQTAPAPWTPDANVADPDFSWCDEDDQKCRSALATNVDGGSDVLLYNSAAWAFFHGEWDGDYGGQCEGSCQSNMMRVVGEPENLVWYSINTRKTDVMVLDGKEDPDEAGHAGGWEGVLQVYRVFS